MYDFAVKRMRDECLLRTQNALEKKQKKTDKIWYEYDLLDIWPQLYICFRLHVQFEIDSLVHTHVHYAYLLRALPAVY